MRIISKVITFLAMGVLIYSLNNDQIYDNYRQVSLYSLLSLMPFKYVNIYINNSNDEWKLCDDYLKVLIAILCARNNDIFYLLCHLF